MGVLDSKDLYFLKVKTTFKWRAFNQFFGTLAARYPNVANSHF